MKKNIPFMLDIVLLLCFPLLLAIFFIEEKVITDNYVVIGCYLDNFIPFIPQFIFAYVLWYPVIVSPFFFFMKDKEDYRRYMYFLIIGFSVTLLIYRLFPNGQELRPVLPISDSFSERLVGILYSNDTNTNVCPSLHVILCIGVAAAVFHNKSYRLLQKYWMRILITFVLLLICASTVFLRQHSVIDVVSASFLGGFIYLICYRLLTPKAFQYEKYFNCI